MTDKHLIEGAETCACNKNANKSRKNDRKYALILFKKYKVNYCNSTTKKRKYAGFIILKNTKTIKYKLLMSQFNKNDIFVVN